MKHLCSTLFVFFALAFNASAQNCINPVSTAIYQSNFNQIAIVRSDAAKLEKANAFVKNNCVMADQVKNIALLFSADSVRMIFCQEAWHHTYDSDNFFVVYDAFTAFSWALRTYDYVSHQPKKKVVAVLVDPVPPVILSPVYPVLDYPDTMRITAAKGCAGPVITEVQLKAIGDNVFRQPTDESKVVAIEQAANANSLSMTHIIKLTSLVSSQDLRLSVLKSTFPRVYDQEHYPFAAALLFTQPLKDQWMAFASAYVTPPCVVTEQQFKPLIDEIRALSFPADKLNKITLMAKDRCFNVAQIKTFSREFSFDNDKMKLFKMCYDKCPDKNNYYQLVPELGFSSEQEELRRFINADGK
ncbi:MAG TPA: DUF4476 domain-containing protein [Bacteroidia bacterium]|nr:DUF4476 domain-containing protein [Bacteroidia bacterium]